jgi:transcriptional regulator with AbiEi antitoxin domain of type IV toxin-antitoxin system
MNKTELAGGELEKALEQKLRELLEDVPLVRNLRIQRNPGLSKRAFDIQATWSLPTGGRAELWIDCHIDPRPSQFPYAAYEQRFGPDKKRSFIRVPVFAAPYISQRMAEICEKHNWSWYDLAGNCRLIVPTAMYIERRGFEPVYASPHPTTNLSSPEAARVIRALLAPDNARKVWTQRELVLHFGQLSEPLTEPSLGLVNKVVQRLRDEAFVERHPAGGFRLRDPLGLLEAWRAAYRFDRNRRRGYFTLLRGPELQGRLCSLQLNLQSVVPGGRAAYAAFSAAEFQAPHVRQPSTWLYVNVEAEEEFRKVTEAKPVDSGENIVVLIPDDDGVFYPESLHPPDTDSESYAPRLACTNPVQTYVDLGHCGERGEEGAEALLEQRLKPEWKRQGLL